jgi:hypothetical protein
MHPSREKKILLLAEEQLVFGRSLADVMDARDELRVTHPESLLLQLVDAKVKRMLQRAELGPMSVWAA